MILSSRKLVQMAILAVAVALTSVLVMGIWKGKVQKDRNMASEAEAPDSEMKLTDMEYTEMQQGKRLWTLKASEAKYFKEEQKTELSSVLLTFFLDDGDEVHLESRQGVLFAGTKNIELWDSVHAALPRGYELSTDRAFYEHDKKTIHSETPIRASGPDLQLEGGSWEYRISEDRALIGGGVRGTVLFLPPAPNATAVRK